MMTTKPSTEDSKSSFIAVNLTKRSDEFLHFNENIRQQVYNPDNTHKQQLTFAKIYQSNTNEALEKFHVVDDETLMSSVELEAMTGESHPVEYDSWVTSYVGEIDIRKETLLHFPYDKFSDLLKAIADKAMNISAIILSVYRLADDSNIVHMLTYLLRFGVDVTIMIEVNAKGNEESNISYAHQLKLLGANVIISDSDKKNHAKFIHLIWDDGKETSMIMTGNLNEVTADIYEDYCMITSDPDVVKPMRSNIMQLITSLKSIRVPSGTIFFTQQLAASIIVNNIRAQMDLGEKGSIIIKCNLFTDPLMMGILEEAASTGCKITLICRGECCWKPINPNIQVHRFIHKYLEHSRVYVFGKKVYIGSLDMATHKLFGRFELICRVKDPSQREMILSTLNKMLEDTTRRHYRLVSNGNTHQFICGGNHDAKPNTKTPQDQNPVDRLCGSRLLGQGQSEEIYHKAQEKRKVVVKTKGRYHKANIHHQIVPNPKP